MILIRNLKIDRPDPELLRPKIAKLIGSDDFDYEVYRMSLDSRREIVFNCQVIVKAELNPRQVARIKDATAFSQEEYRLKPASKPGRVLVVGSGPAGLFCAYNLARHGAKPIVIEQGEPVEDRVKTIEAFLRGGPLNPESNVQFGEGGAGTYSDGKLTARSKDPRQREVLRIFVQHGGPAEIMYQAKPHIGTDLLQAVIVSMREQIIEWGGQFHFSTYFEDLKIKAGKVEALRLNGDWLGADNYVLALGNSARQSFELLAGKLSLESKPFAVGFRIEHEQDMINRRQYRAERPDLPSASYSLKYTDKELGLSAYTFCMCPGGYVINASSEPGRVVVNGMSFHDRSGKNANSALIATVDSRFYGSGVLAGLEFQRRIESRAFALGGGDYKSPVQLVGDFIQNRPTQALGRIRPTVRPGYQLANLRGIYPDKLDQIIVAGLQQMDRQIPGFAGSDAVLTGVETRSSSPVRLLRDRDLRAVGLANLYPIGEGSGYSGGIVSSAIDGLKAAEKILQADFLA